MDCYIGEIRMFAGAYAPMGWLFCNGQALPISGNEALYALIGTTYGGDGKTNFALPNLQARLPVGASNTPPPGMLNTYLLASTGGALSMTLSVANMPAHTHTFQATTADATTVTPGNSVTFAKTGTGFNSYIANPSSLVALNPLAVSYSPGGAPHRNDMPSITLNYIIAVTGEYPQQG